MRAFSPHSAPFVAAPCCAPFGAEHRSNARPSSKRPARVQPSGTPRALTRESAIGSRSVHGFVTAIASRAVSDPGYRRPSGRARSCLRVPWLPGEVPGGGRPLESKPTTIAAREPESRARAHTYEITDYASRRSLTLVCEPPYRAALRTGVSPESAADEPSDPGMIVGSPIASTTTRGRGIGRLHNPWSFCTPAHIHGTIRMSSSEPVVSRYAPAAETSPLPTTPVPEHASTVGECLCVCTCTYIFIRCHGLTGGEAIQTFLHRSIYQRKGSIKCATNCSIMEAFNAGSRQLTVPATSASAARQVTSQLGVMDVSMGQNCLASAFHSS